MLLLPLLQGAFLSHEARDAWCMVCGCGVCNVGNVHLGVNYEMQRATDSVYVIAWESFLLHHGKKKRG